MVKSVGQVSSSDYMILNKSESLYSLVSLPVKQRGKFLFRFTFILKNVLFFY